jgi:hypothetical protein
MAAPVTIVLGTITIASRLMGWSDAIRALASNAMRRRFVPKLTATNKTRPSLLNNYSCVWHDIRSSHVFMLGTEFAPCIFNNRRGKNSPTDFRKLELWCIVSLFKAPVGFPYSSWSNRFDKHTRCNALGGLHPRTIQTIRLNFRREDHICDWPGSIKRLCAARSDLAFLRATPHRRSQPDV